MKYPPPGNTRIIFDFDTESTSGQWQTVNDTVMGGVSNSLFAVLPEGIAKFSGNVSMENNGGFASVRTLVGDVDLAPYSGIKLLVKGDGNTYAFRLRIDREFDGVSYRIPIQTEAGVWQEITRPFEEFVPTFRGRILRNLDPLNPASIRQLGFIISNKQVGEFELLIDWIGCYRL